MTEEATESLRIEESCSMATDGLDFSLSNEPKLETINTTSSCVDPDYKDKPNQAYPSIHIDKPYLVNNLPSKIGPILADIFEHLLRHHCNSTLAAHAWRKHLQQDRAQLTLKLLKLRAQHSSIVMEHWAQARAKQEAMQASLAQFAESMRDVVEKTKVECSQEQSGALNDVSTWQQDVEEGMRMRRVKLGTQLALFRSQTEQMKARRQLGTVVVIFTIGMLFVMHTANSANKAKKP